MNLKRGFQFLTGMLGLILLFQNCDKASTPALFSSDSTEKSSDPETDSGIPYDGKIFALLGPVCSDSTPVQARIAMKGAGSAALIRKDCQDIAPQLLSSSEFQYNSATPNQLIYQNKTFNYAPPEAVGVGYAVLPKLQNPVDPTNYGAKGDGVTDNTVAFTNALNAGDLLIPAGTYQINGTILVPAGRQIQCQSLTSVKLVNSLTTTQNNNSTFRFTGLGGSISNCRISGTEVFNANGSAVFDVNSQNNSLVSVVDFWQTAGDVKVINNIFENCHGNACLLFYGGTTEVSNNAVVYNTFRNCGYYGVVIDGSRNTRVSMNHLTDCSMTVENNTLAQVNFNNILDFNFMTVVRGLGRMAGTSGSVPSLSGGVGNLAADYSTNLVHHNTLVGNGTQNSLIILNSTPIPAQYSENTCTNGCGVVTTR